MIRLDRHWVDLFLEPDAEGLDRIVFPYNTTCIRMDDRIIRWQCRVLDLVHRRGTNVSDTHGITNSTLIEAKDCETEDNEDGVFEDEFV